MCIYIGYNIPVVPGAGRSLWGWEERLALPCAVHSQLQDKAQAEAEKIVKRREQQRAAAMDWLQPLIPHPFKLLGQQEEAEELGVNGWRSAWGEAGGEESILDFAFVPHHQMV